MLSFCGWSCEQELSLKQRSDISSQGNGWGTPKCGPTGGGQPWTCQGEALTMSDWCCSLIIIFRCYFSLETPPLQWPWPVLSCLDFKGQPCNVNFYRGVRFSVWTLWNLKNAYIFLQVATLKYAQVITEWDEMVKRSCVKGEFLRKKHFPFPSLAEHTWHP